jgi:hypothetical protein
MKQLFLGGGFMIGALLGALCAGVAYAGDPGAPTSAAIPATPELKQSDTINTNTTPPQHDGGRSDRNAGDTATYSPGVDEVLRMVQAGVAKEVIKAYIESAPIAYRLTAADLIALKHQAVPDELATAMLKRGTEVVREVNQLNNLHAAPPASAGANRSYRGFDPEAYDYFQYYYLYPRTLAAANERFFSSSPSFSGFAPYHYGYFGPMPFQPYSPFAFRHP